MTTTAVRDGRFRVIRIQNNVVARLERRLLTWLCGRLPSWVTPDGLTLLGVFAAVLILLSDIASRASPAFLWLASLGLVIHWFGDSLDGSLARHRGIERPVYGYFLDHTVDALCNLFIMVGLGLTLNVRMDVSLFALVGYYLLCMYAFIKNHVSGVFQLSYLGFGPTELRIGLIGINIWMYVAGRQGTTVAGQFFSPYDALLLFAGSMFTIVFIVLVIAGIREYRDPARSGASNLAGQSASTNASSAEK